MKNLQSSWLLRLLVCAWLCAMAVGCASDRLSERWTGPKYAPGFEVEPWSVGGSSGSKLLSPHYEIYTTISNEDIRRRIVATMEGALEQYSRVTPGVPITLKRMPCYIFANRPQWLEYTRATTGKDAAIYVQINRGGYAIRDVYAAYWLGGENGTISVSAHEGWHQFVARHFVSRLPPFMEEGFATTFEDVEWIDDLPRWNPAINRQRALSVRRVVEERNILPLRQLVAQHAGEFVNRPSTQIEAFYAEAWAFARFLREGQNGKYRQPLEKMLSDIARGFDDAHSKLIVPNQAYWNPSAVRPLLEKYLGVSIEELEQQFNDYLRHLASEGFKSQWEG